MHGRTFVGRFNRSKNDPLPGVYTPDKSSLLAPLPDTQFWETDVVTYEGEIWIVTHIIAYEPSPAYYIAKGLGPQKGPSIANVPEKNLKLLHRGNLWSKYHNEPVVFASISDEAEFYHRLGETEDVAKSDGRYDWSFSGAKQALHDGVADAVLGQGIYPRRSRYFLVKFNNREVGERVREWQIELMTAE